MADSVDPNTIQAQSPYERSQGGATQQHVQSQNADPTESAASELSRALYAGQEAIRKNAEQQVRDAKVQSPITELPGSQARQEQQQAPEQRQEEPKKQDLTKPPKLKLKAEQWNEVKQKLTAAEQEVQQTKQAWEQEKAQILAQMEELKRGAAPAQKTPELEQLAKQNEELLDRIRGLDIRQDPTFRAKYDAQRNAISKQALNAAGEKKALLEAAMALPLSIRGAELDRIVSELPSSSRNLVSAAINMLNQVDMQEQVEVEAAKATYDLRQQERQRESLLAQSRRGTEFERVQQAWKQDGIDTSKFSQHAKEIFDQWGNLDPSTQAQVALRVAALSDLTEAHEQALSRIAQLEQNLARYTSATPGSGQNGDYGQQQRQEPQGLDQMRANIEGQLRRSQSDRLGIYQNYQDNLKRY